MSGISSSTGLISGLNTSALIDQLIAVESKPKTLIQQRLVDIQKQQAAYLDLNSKLAALKTAAGKLRLNSIFDSAKASSSAEGVLTGTASAKATPGNYSFIVDRLASTQQLLSRGFADRGTSSVGLTSLTVESTQARLDSDTDLTQLNGAQGVARGKIVVTNRAGTSRTVDLSKVATVREVLDAVNADPDLHVSASVRGGKIVLTDSSGGSGSLSVRSAQGYTTAASLGIEGTVNTDTLTGSDIYTVGDATSVRSFNDGLGVRFNSAGGQASYDFKITARDGTVFNIDIGNVYGADGKQTAAAVTNVQQLKARVAAQTGGKVTVDVRADGKGLRLVDTTGGSGNLKVEDISGAAADLGFVQDVAAASIDGKALLGGLNSTLLSTIRGGRGLSSTDFRVTDRAGTSHRVDLTGLTSVSEVLDAINTVAAGAVRATLDANGSKIVLTDLTGGTGNFSTSGAAAADLGFVTPLGGLAANTLTGNRLDHQYVGEGTLLSSLNGGKGVGTGTFSIVDSKSVRQTVTIDSGVLTVGDLIKRINAGGGVTARINDAGNGIVVERSAAAVAAGGVSPISITDTAGSVAKALNLAGTAADGTTNNRIDGSFRRTIALSNADTLDGVISKINSAGAGITAGVVTDGSSTTPYRLRLTSALAGDVGRFQVETAGTDLGFSTIADGANARVFYGAADPARAILVSRDSNTVDGVVENLRVDAKSVSATPVTVTVTRDDDAAVKAIQDFVTAFNTLSTKLADLTSYDADTQKKGTLLGDSTALSLRQDLFSTLQGAAQGVGGRYKLLAQVGLSVTRDSKIAIDETKLRAALTADPKAVADLFSAFEQTTQPTTVQVLPGVQGITTPNLSRPTYTKLGVFERFAQLADRYLNSVDGTLTTRGKFMDQQVKSLNDQIATLDERIAAKRTALETQFSNLETSLSKLKSQQSSLAGLATGSSR
jgi:flagellar hook-associated protein 2